jgi:hypothetical protein
MKKFGEIHDVNMQEAIDDQDGSQPEEIPKVSFGAEPNLPFPNALPKIIPNQFAN